MGNENSATPVEEEDEEKPGGGGGGFPSNEDVSLTWHSYLVHCDELIGTGGFSRVYKASVFAPLEGEPGNSGGEASKSHHPHHPHRRRLQHRLTHLLPRLRKPHDVPLAESPVSEGCFQPCALKVIPKSLVAGSASGDTSSEESQQLQEKEVMVALTAGGVPHVVRLYWSWSDPSYYYLLMELCPRPSASLWAFLRQLKEHGALLEEQDLRFIAHQLAEALLAVHAAGFIYRDVKPENVLLTPDKEVRLIDFGLALRLGEPSEEGGQRQVSARSGTFRYLSPELLGSEGALHGTPHDWWGLGMLLFVCSSLEYPFDSQLLDKPKQLFAAIKDPEVLPAYQRISHLSPQGVAFIQALLDKDPSRRLGDRDILQHPWLCDPPSKPSPNLACARLNASYDVDQAVPLRPQELDLLHRTLAIPSEPAQIAADPFYSHVALPPRLAQSSGRV
ncbi:MAG: serine/threonine-protein kinase, partial [archaeon]|nr:serine/threonine-protein kinase [archaeon]